MRSTDDAPQTPRDHYVVAFRGSRDHYQAALALQEAKRLTTLVTDFYTPDMLVRPAVPSPLRRRLSRRHCVGLPSAYTSSVGPLSRLPRSDDRRKDAALGRAAAARAREGSLVYSYYWLGFRAARAAETHPHSDVVFQVHPVAPQIRAAVRADRELWGIDAAPEAEESLSDEDVAEMSRALMTADGYICASQYVRQGLIDLGADPSAVRVAAYGAKPLPRMASDDSGAGGAASVSLRVGRRPLRLLWVGQLSYRKAPHWLFDTIRSIPAGHVELSIVTRDPLPAWLAPLPSSARLYNGLGTGEVQRLMSQSDLLVMPSLVEGFGLVYLEALAAGLPVIATSRSGVPDIVPEGHGAVIVDPSRPASLTEALDDLLSRPSTIYDLRHEVSTLRLPTWRDFRRDLLRGLAAIE